MIALSSRRNRVLFGAAAAIAASLALYLSLGETGTPPDSSTPSSPVVIADTTRPPSLEEAIPNPTSVIEPELEASQWAEAPVPEPVQAVSPASVYAEEVKPDLELAEAKEPVVAPVEDLASTILPDSDERLAIALDYEMLADFDVISNLELLEYLGEFENVESM